MLVVVPFLQQGLRLSKQFQGFIKLVVVGGDVRPPSGRDRSSVCPTMFLGSIVELVGKCFYGFESS